MRIIVELTLKEYLLRNNIFIIGEYFKNDKPKKDEDIINQIKIINKLNNLLSGYKETGITRINGSIGKRIEGVKVEVKKLESDLRKRNNKDDLNNMDIFLLENGERILNVAREALKNIKSIDYLSLIKRSMNRGEICIGKGDESNLRSFNSIEIGKIKNISYNIYEEDIYEYLKKVRKKYDNFREDYYISEYVREANLSNASKEYIKILLSIPHDSLRQWHRYVDGKRDVSPDIYLENIKESLKYESNIIKEPLNEQD